MEQHCGKGAACHDREPVLRVIDLKRKSYRQRDEQRRDTEQHLGDKKPNHGTVKIVHGTDSTAAGGGQEMQ